MQLRVIRKIMISLLLISVTQIHGQEKLLQEKFRNPNDNYGLDIWWHWQNGNISREAIWKDLNSMHNNGIKRATILNVNGEGQYVPRVSFASPEWFEMFRYALDVADSLGMTIGVHNCDGWSESGGPWIPVEKSMKTYTWSDSYVKGGGEIHLVLPQPKTNLDYYRDWKVVAFPDKKKKEEPDFLNFRELFSHIPNTGIRDITPRYAEKAVAVKSRDVMDLTSLMRPDGSIVWNAPNGKWRIVRIGYTTTGQTNGPATEEGRGLECDKMDESAVKLHFSNFPAKLIEAAGNHRGKTFEFLLIDSWECKYTNWTADFPKEFEALNGYSLVSWIPAMCGCVVNNQEQTSAFLHDYQKTIATLIENNYYRTFADLTHKEGLDLHAEPIYGNSLEYPPAFSLRANGYCDLPMTEFWAYPGKDGQPAFDWKEFLFDEFAIDATLVCKKQVIGAEAYTGDGNFCETPQLLRPFGDAAFCAGINQLILHSYVMQPLDYTPNLKLLDFFGAHFNRNNPWWRMASGWCLYQKRIQYMLQHGSPVIDALYYLGDQLPENFPLQLTHHDIPFGYRACCCDYDYLDHMEEDGFTRLIIPEGVMLEARTKEKLEQLKKSGIEIHYAKNGKVIPFDQKPDLELEEENTKPFRFLHKHNETQEVYFLFNQHEEAFCGNFIFRTTGMIPELWDAETGAVYAPVEWKELEDGRTSVNLHFKPHQTMFVVFGNSSSAKKVPQKKASFNLDKYTATVSFEPFYDAEISPYQCDQLQSLTLHSDEQVRDFGGFVNYRIVFDALHIPNGNLLALNLGRLSATASVKLNGKPLADVWHDDTDLFISELLPRGNILEVKVATTLHNRMAADVKEYGKPTHISTVMNPATLKYFKETERFDSGLIGPLSISIY